MSPPTTPYPPLPERAAVDAAVFQSEIVPAGEPVVLRGQMADWPAVKLSGDGLASYLTQSGGATPVTVMRADPSQQGRFFYDAKNIRQFNFTQGRAPFTDVIGWLSAGVGEDALYIGSTPVAELLPGLASDFATDLVPEGTGPRIWIGNRTVVSTHHDGSSNIAGVVAGRRRFTLFPPDQVANLYPGPLEHTVAGPQLSLVDVEAPDLQRFPRFIEAQAVGRSAELEPGDAIYIPPLWWHHVRALSGFNVLVNFWWRDRPQISREPMEALLLSLLALRQLPEPEREAWRAMFDYFVFQTSGPPMAHLPPELGGVLGEISPARAEQIWQFFRDALSGK